MSLAIVHSRAHLGVTAPAISVETHLANGFPGISIVGMPETAVRESRERVRCAILNAGLEFPARRITVNLAPAGLPKAGGRYDLAIATGILAASGQIPADALSHYELLGELALTGELRPVEGVLPAAIEAREAEQCLILPRGNQEEVSLVRGVSAVTAADLRGVCDHFRGHGGEGCWQRCRYQPPVQTSPRPRTPLASIRGQAMAKRALVIAAAGGHNLLLIGPPGSGKTLLANALHGLLPALSEEQALEVAAIRSTGGQQHAEMEHDMVSQWRQPPFRSPHHTATGVALTGGGRGVLPGEVTLAHRGLLFLDELPEFRREALEGLREPMEARTITISRSRHRIRFPADFQLVAAMNPCPCGYDGDPDRSCRCRSPRIAQYLDRLSGPFLDRLDMAVEVHRIGSEELLPEAPELSRAEPVGPDAIAACRRRQWQRAGMLNAQLGGERLHRHCTTEPGARRLLESVMKARSLSARSVHRLLRTARTVADLEQSPVITGEHVAEAIACRNLARFRLGSG